MRPTGGSEGRHAFEMPTAPVVREVTVGETQTVSELAQKMAVKANEVIKVLMNIGVMATINQPLDQDTALLVVEEMGHTAKVQKENQIEEDLQGVPTEEPSVGDPRPPVVTVMGHVDHGKTSLLDYIRSTKVAAGEAGGITQHIGAYHVETPKGVITFLDTPGHAAFTAMRARGAQGDRRGCAGRCRRRRRHAADYRSDSACACGRSAHRRCGQQDRQAGCGSRPGSYRAGQARCHSEEWGGETIFVNVSARTGAGIDTLLESILLQAEMLELRAPRDGLASGIVIESSVEKGRGAVATVLVKKGTLRMGDPILAGAEFGRVRAMFDETGDAVQAAAPSMPVVVLGSGEPAERG